MPGVIGDDSGFPKRCFTWTFPNGEKFTFCIVWLEWPSVIWRHIKPDPGPERVQIEGVSLRVPYLAGSIDHEIRRNAFEIGVGPLQLVNRLDCHQ